MSVKYSEVIERMRRAGNLKNDSKVARALGITPQALSNYKKRERVPSDLILKFSAIYGVSVDWLLTGEGGVYMEGGRKAPAPSVLREAVFPHGREEMEGGGAGGLTASANLVELTPEELVYVGKLLRVMRCLDKVMSSVLKWTIDAFFKATEGTEQK
ncbi:MAG: helix-turn-helix domain-containing protein [Deltaproteobacteria bacterium]|nr:helix-turn-helix domain-containing protein [Deltaproteobacteria bacterium]